MTANWKTVRVFICSIKQAKLGLDVVSLQTKRWENTVGRPHVRQFVGVLAGQQANRGGSSPPRI